jgi:mono/diheme cytochrome c family protein
VFGIFCALGWGLLIWGVPRPAVGERASTTLSQLPPALQLATPTPFSNPTATPSSQGGHGQNIFHVFCMPCHGDVGQGLTDEFRAREYPPEDVNCWKSGCHGARPYENGFTLPKTIPALIGPGTLTKFATARNTFDYVRAAMPFNAPGSLSEEQYLQLLAYLLEQNNVVPAGARLDPNTLQQISLRPERTPAPAASAAVALPDNTSALTIAIILLFGVVVLAVLIMRRLARHKLQ